tara:strand:+ start:1128 stop:1748 length:621 start_codon:yes stop_codon:yes gene_type:complete
MCNSHDDFKDFKFLEDTDGVVIGKIPKLLQDNLVALVEKYRKVKDSPLGYLRHHVNYGKNSYQISLTPNDLYESFLMGYLNNLGETYVHVVNKIDIEKVRKQVIVTMLQGLEGGIGVWINYGYQGDENNWHSHKGSLSGVIYINNPKEVKTNFRNDKSFIGNTGDIIIFKSDTEHCVDKLEEEQERITIAFNMDFIGVNEQGFTIE